MDFAFMFATTRELLTGLPLTLQLAGYSLVLGGVLALLFAMMRMSGFAPLQWLARSYVFIFRGTPLLVQIFLIYYGLGQFPWVRHSFLWPFLREPYWCAILALTLNTGAYGSEIIRGGLLAVPYGAIDAARACGMGRLLMFRRIILPTAVRQALPAYSSEVISMVKATSLASIVTMMEMTGIANKLISQTFRAVEIFICAGAIYLLINFLLTRAMLAFEYWLSPHLRDAPRGATEQLDITLNQA
jgi:octopine/nopaline transport system permease protein